MSRSASHSPTRSNIRNAIGSEVLALLLIFFFTKEAKYCIISLAGSAIGIAGFLTLIRQTDRILKTGKGKTMFFLTGLAKLLVIAGMFHIASRLAGNGAIFFMQGLAMIFLSMTGSGMWELFKKGRHGT